MGIRAWRPGTNALIPLGLEAARLRGVECIAVRKGMCSYMCVSSVEESMTQICVLLDLLLTTLVTSKRLRGDLT